ncbi:unnamed protein product [Bursaphelenchus okinawaensis]|uniref:Acid phosphatase n=1 Tax=Bursaphelenchus okinawaensis TaxID=465554 RepID=A0A811KYB1_9BILA|nr:unnamed protein product [Bursaphelenchus okinawaensis]CAG9115332.1 unnamed protein product [Bursaphelenchus okinawaensis]
MQSVVLCCLVLVCSGSDKWDTLEYVQIIFRHGDRTPQNLVVTVPGGTPAEWTKLGNDELTSLGLEQAIHLGRVIKQRYEGYISESYDNSELSLRSSDFGRTISSAQGVLAGMYNETVQRIGYVPKGVKMKAQYNDKEMYYHAPCPKAENERWRVLNGDNEFVNLKDSYSHLLNIMEENVINPNSNFGLGDVFAVADSLKVMKLHNMTLPYWVTNDVYNDIMYVNDQIGWGLFKTHLLKRLRAGPLLDNLLRRMHNYIVGVVDQRQRIRLLSGHDTSLSALISVWGLNITTAPELCSALALQLHYHRDVGYYVKFFYRNSTNSDKFVEVQSDICGKTCPLKKLTQYTDKLVPTNWLKECGFGDEFVVMAVKQSERKYLGIFVLQTTIFVLVLVVAALKWFGTKLGRRVIPTGRKTDSINMPGISVNSV